jgi:DNA recombination protein RmuC
MQSATATLLVLLAFFAGAALAWIAIRRNSRRELNALQTELNAVAQDRTQLRERAERIPELVSRAAELEKSREDVLQANAQLREAIGKATTELTMERATLEAARSELQETIARKELALAEHGSMAVKLADLGAQLAAERRQGEEKLALIKEAKESLTTQFQNLANEILEEKSRRFTEQNRTNLGQLLDPLRVKITEFQAKVENVYDNEARDRTMLGEQVRQLMSLNQTLSQDAQNLTSALKGSSKTQGTWGEFVLESVLEKSGLRKGEEYDIQESRANELGSRSQPDVTIHLPEERHLVIDSKVSLVAYEQFATTEDEEERSRALKRHLDSVRGHMKSLSEKKYQDLYGLNSLDFVLMFVPIESAFMTAVSQDRALFMDGWQKNVLLVSPSTLLFVVRTVAHLWRQEAQNKNAQEIAKRGGDLYDRLCSFVVDLEKVGERLGQAQDSFNNARDKLSKNKGNVIRQAEMLRGMGVKPSKQLSAQLVQLATDEGESGEATQDVPR